MARCSGFCFVLFCMTFTYGPVFWLLFCVFLHDFHLWPGVLTGGTDTQNASRICQSSANCIQLEVFQLQLARIPLPPQNNKTEAAWEENMKGKLYQSFGFVRNKDFMAQWQVKRKTFCCLSEGCSIFLIPARSHVRINVR